MASERGSVLRRTGKLEEEQAQAQARSDECIAKLSQDMSDLESKKRLMEEEKARLQDENEDLDDLSKSLTQADNLNKA